MYEGARQCGKINVKHWGYYFELPFNFFASLTHHKPQMKESMKPVFLTADYHLLCSNKMGVVASTTTWRRAGIRTWIQDVYNCVPTLSLNSDCNFDFFPLPLFFSLPPDFAIKHSHKTSVLIYVTLLLVTVTYSSMSWLYIPGANQQVRLTDQAL